MPESSNVQAQTPKIIGYRTLTDAEVHEVNEVKALAEQVRLKLEFLETKSGGKGELNPDLRWLNIARTQLQQGFMAVTRSITKPVTF